jgi:hypothetical protein
VPIHWLDADVYIQAKNGPYPFHRVAPFWEFLSEQLDRGNIRSPKAVYDEIVAGNDPLADWFAQREEKGLSIIASEVVCRNYTRIADHVTTSHSAHQAAEFLRGGDGWVIAHAMEEKGIVVTQESVRSVKAKVKVPAVCEHFGVVCRNTYEMLEALDFKV